MKEMINGVENWLIQIGIMPNLAGFTYIKESVKIVCEYGDVARTTNLYKIIASAHGKTSSAIERSIRHAIKVACDSCKIIRLNNVVGQSVLGSCLDKPSPSLLISLLAHKHNSLFG